MFHTKTATRFQKQRLSPSKRPKTGGKVKSAICILANLFDREFNWLFGFGFFGQVHCVNLQRPSEERSTLQLRSPIPTRTKSSFVICCREQHCPMRILQTINAACTPQTMRFRALRRVVICVWFNNSTCASVHTRLCWNAWDSLASIRSPFVCDSDSFFSGVCVV